MTREETIGQLKFMLEQMPEEPPLECDYTEEWLDTDRKIRSAFKTAIKIIEQEPCEDAISRQEALKGYIEVERADGVEIYSEKAVPITYINNLPPVTPTQRWIPVSERLPEEDEVVLGTNSSNDLFQTYTWDDCGEIKWYADGCFDVPVVAWMPLPEPYKAGSEW